MVDFAALVWPTPGTGSALDSEGRKTGLVVSFNDFPKVRGELKGGSGLRSVRSPSQPRFGLLLVLDLH